MTLQKAVTSILKPDFHEYNTNRKRPTKASIERLASKYDAPDTQPVTERVVYLVEIQFGVTKDITANPMTSPSAKMIYLSPNGYIHTAYIDAKINDSGGLEPIRPPRPTASRPTTKGRKATKEELEVFLPVIEEAHEINLNTKASR